MIKHFLVTLFLFLVSLKDTLETNSTKSSLVVDLTDKNLNEFLKNNENVLIKFYTHWCGECKRMEPIYHQLAELVNEKDLNVKIARIEVEENPNAGRKFQINLYPTFIFIRNYERVKFEDQNELNDLFSFVKAQLKNLK
jgi:protein disulfide-isomerase-like protein